MTEWRLYLGTKSTGIIVRPDEKYPTMYRVHWADRAPSEMANLTRAKDAAWSWIAREGGQTGRSLKWKHTEKALQARYRALEPSPR